MATRRFGPLVVAQACGALNDNLVKNAMVVLALFTLGVGGTGLSAAAGALFIAPYILFSATAGKLADRLSKPRLIVVYKLAEVALMAAAALASPSAACAARSSRVNPPIRCLARASCSCRLSRSIFACAPRFSSCSRTALTSSSRMISRSEGDAGTGWRADG
jgi:MFS family permease